MPLTEKGNKILRSMRREYGGKRGESVFYASKNAGRISGVDAAQEPRKLAYYASLLPGKESQYQTPEGYRIYKNVPIARTGSQTYLGKEIKKNEGYRPEWNIGDDEQVEVHRPYDEVTSPETIASFEGKSVLDEHPAGDKVLVDALDEFDGMSKGHAQNVRVGDKLPDGETSLVADLLVKHPELNVKVDGGVRDVSCGYTFVLDKDEGGRLVQRKIRGNHVAVVPEGRAGRDVGIKDSAIKITHQERFSMKKISSLFSAIGFQNWAKDAKPEEVADALEELKEEKKDGDGEKDTQFFEGPEGYIHPIRGSKGYKKSKTSDAKDAKKSARDAARAALDKAIDAYMATKDADDDDEDDDHEDEGVAKIEAEEKSSGDRKGGKDDAEILPVDERGKTDFKVGDAASLLMSLRPLVAKSKDKGAKDSFNRLVEAVRPARDGAKDGAPNPFEALTRISNAAIDAEPEIPMFEFFNGKSHADGLKAWNEYQATKGAR